jgi:diguanylate cyclase (GGDEF)-like protein/PAS domain S-box-containing protein
VVPILRQPEVVVGVLCVADTSSRVVTAEMRSQLMDFANLAAVYLSQQAEYRDLADDAALYRVLVENSADTHIKGDLDGVRRYVSPSIRSLLGYEPHELVGRRASEIVHHADVADFGVQMKAMYDGVIDSFTTEHRMLHKDGSWVWLEAFVKVIHHSITGDRDGYVVSVRDTSRRKELETRLTHNTSHDALTGLPNRALLDERLQQEIDRVRHHGSRFALLCLDLDGFKQVNDALGHEAGDAVLAAVAARLTSCVRAADTVARRGGDEFVIIHVTDSALPASAVTLAECLIEAVSVPMESNVVPVHIGLSIGIAVAADGCTQPQALLRDADKAMYEAKAAGRNGYRVSGAAEQTETRRALSDSGQA